MQGKYLGRLKSDDRLYSFLHKILSDRFAIRESHPEFRVFRLTGSNEVYAYQERKSRSRLICKFYGTSFGWDRERGLKAARKEYESLELLRGYDLIGSPHHVIKPLGIDKEINCVLAVEYYRGEQFSQAIQRCITHNDCGHLYSRLTALAYFLATQHNRTASGSTVDFDQDVKYFRSLTAGLHDRHKVEQKDVDELCWLGDLWRNRSQMWQDRQVWLHGDATPANFIFGGGLDVGAIDLERMKRGDRMFDVGRIAGELQHAFMRATGDKYRAEPFIGHFLWEYACHFPDRYSAFQSITSRTPYYMGLNLLRIARNDYITCDYSGRLVAEAKELLRAT